MTTFTWTPSFDATENSEPRVRQFAAGDGYSQRTGFGINRDPKTWDLTFENRDDTERDQIATFLEARGGIEAFDWTPPRGAAGRYRCEQWQIPITNCNNNQIRATFIEVFEP